MDEVFIQIQGAQHHPWVPSISVALSSKFLSRIGAMAMRPSASLGDF